MEIFTRIRYPEARRFNVQRSTFNRCLLCLSEESENKIKVDHVRVMAVHEPLMIWSSSPQSGNIFM